MILRIIFILSVEKFKTLTSQMTVLILIVSLVFADHADTYAFQQLHLPLVFIPHSRLILLELLLSISY